MCLFVEIIMLCNSLINCFIVILNRLLLIFKVREKCNQNLLHLRKRYSSFVQKYMGLAVV